MSETFTLIKTLCENSIDFIYTDDINALYKERLAQELRVLQEKGHIEKLFLAKNFLSKLSIRKDSYKVCGAVSNLLTAYLLGISNINPMEYDLPFELAFTSKGSLPLEFVFPDDIRPEIEHIMPSMVPEGKALKLRINDDCFTGYVLIEKENIAELQDYIYVDEESGIEYCGSNIPRDKVTEIICNYSTAQNIIFNRIGNQDDRLATSTRIQEEIRSEKAGITTGILAGFYDIATRFSTLSNNKFKDMVRTFKPRNFNQMVKLLAFGHITLVNELLVDGLVKDGVININTLISSREDIYEHLIAHGLPKEQALEITVAVSYGRVSRGKCNKWLEYKEIMLEKGIADWFLVYCENIKYLFPRAHVINEAMMIYETYHILEYK